MELPSIEVLRVFREKGVPWLRHANTVRTTCTFLEHAHIMARGVVHERSLGQTAQRSDRGDRRLGIWYDLFFDAADIHVRYRRRNLYGPVLLNFDLVLLEQDWLPFVWVTKTNPIYWRTTTPHSQRWFSSIKELEADYDPQLVHQHIVLRNVAGTVRLNPYLREIIVDWTNIKRDGAEKTYAQEAAAAILAAAARGGVSLTNVVKNYRTIERHTKPNCICFQEYSALEPSKLLQLFSE